MDEDADTWAELAALDIFTRIPPELAAAPQPSTWLDGEPHETIPGWQLRGRRVMPNRYTLWRISDPATRRPEQIWAPWGDTQLFTLDELHQAAELLSGEILCLVEGLLPTIAYFLPRDRPY